MANPFVPENTLMTLPIFPLEGALLLPDGELPLHIFEPRYVAMTKAALAGDRLIGMIQPCKCPEKFPENVRPYYRVGCIGRIVSYEETAEKHFNLTLQGVARFTLLSHELHEDGYRLAQVTCDGFPEDFREPAPLPECLARPTLIEKLQTYLHKEGLYVDWSIADQVPDARFYTLLAMVCPFKAPEKQALLEAPTFEERCRLLKSLLDISCAEDHFTDCTRTC